MIIWMIISYLKKDTSMDSANFMNKCFVRYDISKECILKTKHAIEKTATKFSDGDIFEKSFGIHLVIPSPIIFDID